MQEGKHSYYKIKQKYKIKIIKILNTNNITSSKNKNNIKILDTNNITSSKNKNNIKILDTNNI